MMQSVVGYPYLCNARICFDAGLQDEGKMACSVARLVYESPGYGLYCLMGHEGRVAILFVELLHGRA